jgi:hypothetical protein
MWLTTETLGLTLLYTAAVAVTRCNFDVGLLTTFAFGFDPMI